MNKTPPAVAMGPPRFGVPSGVRVGCIPVMMLAGSPRATSHAFAPVLRSIATSEPHGGGTHRKPSGAGIMRRRNTDRRPGIPADPSPSPEGIVAPPPRTRPAGRNGRHQAPTGLD